MTNSKNPARGYKELLSENDGQRIHEDTADKWKQTFESYGSGNKLNLKSDNYYFKKEDIMHLLNPSNNVIGIRIYYALSTDGVRQLIIYAVNDSGDDLTANPVVSDGLSPINPVTAAEWRNLYETVEGEHRHGGILTKGHFFGKKCLIELLEYNDAEGMTIFHGLTDKGEKELLIYASKDHKTVCNRYYILDFSRRCPPYC